ncbi:Pex19 protein family-domain-containing protein [Dunaliella salina]|uniref:Pex19 protein family-domain-containing protein n=1 Tax=Dunaliella salina TaxID=3046 RepID=A0ABQ7GQX1_DUNSA|nr:Pex19 protein family-domain-containing protein [Dunaliella salina]|eukprot:KAF5837010.1 Pex19 protein family-domain-containing protein [Dunaliella salina]
MQPNLDALLEDVLKDFNVQPNVPHQPPQQAQGTQPEAVAAAAAADSFRQAPGATSRATGPSGLGLSLPSRPSSSRPDSKPQIHAGKATAEGLAFDPLRRDTARPSPKQQQQQQQQSNAQGRQLPPDVQRLADDLVRLVSETNIGSDASGQGLPSTSGGPAPSAAAPPPPPPPAAAAVHLEAGSVEDADAGRASTIKGLMEHTKRTVAAQSKFSRGERGPEVSSQAGSSQLPQGGPAGGLLSALGGDLGSLGGLLGSAGGEGEGEAGFGSGMVDMIMRQLLSKDVLYTPLKEIRDKYPPWLESCTLPAEELQRYRDQYNAIEAVVRQYDEDPNNFAKLTDLIQEMQKFGDPPAAIVEEIGGSINQPGESSSEADCTGVEGLNPEDLANFELPPDLLKDLPQDLLKDLPPEMQKDCCIM